MKKAATAKNQRSAPRKDLTPLQVSSMSSLDNNLLKLARGGSIVEASTSGFRMMVQRADLVPVSLRKNLNIDVLIGEKVLLQLPDLNLEMSGKVARTKFLGKAGFEIGIDFTDDAPEYWRECLVDLLPGPGEFE